jgi:hypothetical protein
MLLRSDARTDLDNLHTLTSMTVAHSGFGERHTETGRGDPGTAAPC